MRVTDAHVSTHVEGDTLHVDVTLRLVDTQQTIKVTVASIRNYENPGGA